MTVRAVLLLLTVIAAPAATSDRNVIADFTGGMDAGAPKGWQIKEKSGRADWAVVNDGGLTALRLRSADTSFSVQKEVAVDLKQHPILSWKWKVTKLPKGGDFRKSRTDDQAAQLFLAFSSRRAIVYIWDTTAPQGLTETISPVPFMSIKVVVVRSGSADAGAWITETRNVEEDYRKFFDDDPLPVRGVRLQINSQHTGSSAESFFADVEFRRN